MSTSPSHYFVPGAVTRTTPASVLSAEVGTTLKALSPGAASSSVQLLAAAGLDVVDAQRVHARRSADRAVLVGRAVQPVVVDHELVVDEQLGAVVAA